MRSVGIDMIENEILSAYFDDIDVKVGKFPSKWEEGNLVLLHKKEK